MYLEMEKEQATIENDHEAYSISYYIYIREPILGNGFLVSIVCSMQRLCAGKIQLQNCSQLRDETGADAA